MFLYFCVLSVCYPGNLSKHLSILFPALPPALQTYGKVSICNICNITASWVSAQTQLSNLIGWPGHTGNISPIREGFKKKRQWNFAGWVGPRCPNFPLKKLTRASRTTGAKGSNFITSNRKFQIISNI